MIPLIPEAADLGTDVGLHAGFPNAAVEGDSEPLSLDRLLITSPHSTYIFQVRGHRWHHLGIFDSDIAIVDRAYSAGPGHLVVWWDEYGEFHLEQWHSQMTHPIWGTLIATIHQLARPATTKRS